MVLINPLSDSEFLGKPGFVVSQVNVNKESSDLQQFTKSVIANITGRLFLKTNWGSIYEKENLQLLYKSYNKILQSHQNLKICQV